MLVLRERGKLMAWFKVDDGFYTSLKFLSIPREFQVEAAGVWLLTGTWSADKMTDGFVPYAVMSMWAFSDEVIDHLVSVGLWDLDDEHGGIRFHDWCDYQPTREALEAKSVARSEKAKQNVAKRWNKEATDTNAIPTVYQTDTKVIPNDTPEPEPEPSITKVIDISSNAFDEKFNQFWAIYPRKENKQSARRAFKQALKAETLETIIAGALRYRDDPNRDPMFTKHAATWLNNQCWNDDPLPARNKANAKLANQQSAREAFLSATTPEITTNPDWAEIE